MQRKPLSISALQPTSDSVLTDATSGSRNSGRTPPTAFAAFVLRAATFRPLPAPGFCSSPAATKHRSKEWVAQQLTHAVHPLRQADATVLLASIVGTQLIKETSGMLKPTATLHKAREGSHTSCQLPLNVFEKPLVRHRVSWL